MNRIISSLRQLLQPQNTRPPKEFVEPADWKTAPVVEWSAEIGKWKAQITKFDQKDVLGQQTTRYRWTVSGAVDHIMNSAVSLTASGVVAELEDAKTWATFYTKQLEAARHTKVMVNGTEYPPPPPPKTMGNVRHI